MASAAATEPPATSFSTTPGATPRFAPPPAWSQPRRAVDNSSPLDQPTRQRVLASTSTLYSIGQPTDEEQLYLELINQARANPQAMAARYQTTTDSAILEDYAFFKVDLNMMVSQFAALKPAPPLSMNARLTAAARLHSQDMLANQFQGHDGSDGSATDRRITSQGYDWNFYAENVFANAQSVWHGHVAFDVDWGDAPDNGGMQDPPGHRKAIHEPEFREVGIGVVNGSNGKFGPQVVTQDFGRQRNATPFITGVAYYDLNGNSAYDPAEGLGGVTVRVTGSPYHAVTTSSGGYSVPVPNNGAYTATFSLPGLGDVQRTVTVANAQNAKVDFVPVYSAPTVSGPAEAAVNQNNLYQFTPVAGASGYQWKQNRRLRLTEIEGGETGLSRVIAQTSAGYEVLDNSVKASGNYSFHLAHPKQEDQILRLDRLLRTAPSSRLLFSSRLGYAGTAQTARAEISTDGGVTWTSVWQRVGTGNQGQTSFSQEAVPLDAFAGRELQVRFRYAFTKGTFYNQTARGAGWYLDDIQLTDADELLDQRISDVGSGLSFTLQPTAAGDYLLAVRAQLAQRILPWGPAKLVTAQSGTSSPASLLIVGIQSLPANLVQIDFDATDVFGDTLILESAAAITGPWAADAAAAVTVLHPGQRFRATTATDAAPQRFYRIRAR